ncbi:MAG: fibronectin type III domain-containing protein, partial [Actinomycetales bacterium]|nr:fibronectin type III domain-containing protein [Actinomycetales bacterium]
MHPHQRRIGGLNAVFGKIIATTLLIGTFAGIAPAKAAPNPPVIDTQYVQYDGSVGVVFVMGANSIVGGVDPLVELSDDGGATYLPASVVEWVAGNDADNVCSNNERCTAVIPSYSDGTTPVEGGPLLLQLRVTDSTGAAAVSGVLASTYTYGPAAAAPAILSVNPYVVGGDATNAAQPLVYDLRIMLGQNSHVIPATINLPGALDYSTDNGATWASYEPGMYRNMCNNNETCPAIRLTQTSSGTVFAYGQSYQFKVKWKPRYRAEVESAMFPYTTIAAPGAPTITGTTPGNGAITVAYALGQDGGANITTIEYSTDEGITWRNANCGIGTNASLTSCAGATGSVTVTTTSAGATLAKGTSYEIQIRAKNRVGTSEASASALGHTLGAPMPPSLDNAIGSGAGIRVEGTLGLANGGSVIRVEYSTNGGTTWANTGQATGTFTITAPSNNLAASLTAGTTYSVAIRTVTTIGTSAASNIITVKPGAVPGTPILTTAIGGGENITVTGTLGAANGSAISLVEYSTDNGATWASSGQATASFTITETSAAGADLVAGTTYQVRIRARNANGVSGPSTAKSATPNSAPMPPSLESVSSSGAAI